ncbi:MAG: tetratricopeptide repeat protein, partial [Gammaproteobacteria bacterium]|nr:tetratricopeptide repeat protein [Gammaproteobacteria bacterium]
EGASKQVGLLLAIYFAQTEQTDKAIQTYQKLDPENDIQVGLSLARLQTSINQKSQAVSLLNKLFQKNPANVSVLRELVKVIDNAQQLEPYFAHAQSAGVQANAILLLKSKLADKTGKSTANAVAQIVQGIDDPFQRAMSQYILSKRLGKNDEAQMYLDDAARLNPDHARVIAAQFTYAVEQKNWPVAKEIVELAKKNNTDHAKGVLFAGRLELARGKIQTAVTLLGQGMKQRPVYSEGWRWLAQAQRTSGDLVAAESSYKQSIRQSPTNVRAYEGLAQTYDMAGDQSKAIITWRKLYHVAPENRAYRDKYLAYEQRNGDPDKALIVREAIAEQDPQDMGNQRGLAVLYAHLKRMDDAKGLMQKLFAKAPSDRANYGAYAAVLTIGGELEQARSVIDNYLRDLGSQAVTPDYLLGARFLLSVNDKKGAFKRYDQAVAVDTSTDMQASRELADALFSHARFAEAVPYYQAVWQADPQDGRVGYRLAETLQRNKNFAEARNVLEQLEAAIGKSATSLMLKAQIAHHQGQKDQALVLLDEAVDLVPEEAMIYYQRASLLLDDVDRESRVIKDLRKVLELAPNFTAAHGMLAQIHLRHDSMDQAVAAYEAVLSQKPGDMTTRVELLQMYIKANDLLAAKTLLSKSARRFPNDARWPKLQADLAIRDKNHRQASRYLLHAFELEPDSKVLAAMGLEMIHAGSARMAASKIQEHKNLLDSSVHVQAVLARAKYKLKQKTQGKQLMTQAFLQAKSLEEILLVSDQLVAVEGLIGTQKMLQSLKGSTSDIWIEIAIARSEVGAKKYEQASNRLKRIKPRVSEKEKSEFNGLLSLALHNCDKFEEASDIYKQVLLADPNNFAALNNLAYLLATNLNRPAEALPYALSASKQSPNDPEVLDTLGWVQFLAGQTKEAEATLRRSVRIKPFSANTYHLAEVMIKDGQTRYAKQLLDMARQLAQKNADKKMLNKVNVRLKEVTQ